MGPFAAYPKSLLCTGRLVSVSGTVACFGIVVLGGERLPPKITRFSSCKHERSPLIACLGSRLTSGVVFGCRCVVQGDR